MRIKIKIYERGIPMNKKTIAILFGGCSTEYEVSLQSTTSVVQNLDQNKYEVLLIGITRKGEWFRYDGGVEGIKNDTWHQNQHCVKAILSPCKDMQGIIEFRGNTIKRSKVDVVFPVLHGKNGEDGTVQGLLQLSGIPFVGCDTLSSALCMDKDVAHKIANSVGVKTPQSVTIFEQTSIDEIVDLVQPLGFPVYVKPAKAGSSIGITKAENKDQLLQGVIEALKHDDKVVIEENIIGFEVGCAVLGNRDLIIGEVDQIELISDFFDYKEKYTLETAKITLPAKIDNETKGRIKEIAEILYQALGCKGFSRVDMFLTVDGEIVFNEVNTIPGFTTKSRYPNMLCAAGFTYEAILDQLINLALEGELSDAEY